MNALQRLILGRMSELDLTFAEVGRRGDIPSNTVWVLTKKLKHRQPPRAQTLERLAKGLDLPLDVVRAAAAEAAGYRLEDLTTTLDAAEDMRVIAQVIGDLNETDRATLRSLVVTYGESLRKGRQADTR
jgi:hypothetical protein